MMMSTAKPNHSCLRSSKYVVFVALVPGLTAVKGPNAPPKSVLYAAGGVTRLSHSHSSCGLPALCLLALYPSSSARILCNS